MTTEIERRPLTDLQLKTLMANLNPDRVETRKQGQNSLSYLAAYDVKATLIRVFGFANFSSEVTESKIERILNKDEHGGNAAWVVLATATVKLTIHQTGAVYTETASSSQAGSQIGEVADFALKTAESDALKRAAIYLGTQFGLSLYDNGSTRDIIKTVVAPDQLTMRGKRMEADADGNPVMPEQKQEAPANSNQEAAAADAAGVNENGVTPEQHADNQALLERALNAKAINEDGSDRTE